MKEIYSYTLTDYTTIKFEGTNDLCFDKHETVNPLGDDEPLKKKVTLSTDDWDGGYYGKFKQESVSENEEDFIKNYGNPLCTVKLYRRTIVVTEKDNKIALKIFEYNRVRIKATKYFRLSTRVEFLTFNHTTNSLYTGYILDYHKKRKCRKKIRRCIFAEDPINRFRSLINSLFGDYNKKVIEPKIWGRSDLINHIINLFVNSIPGTEKYPELSPELKLYKRYLDYSGIKFSNNWSSFILYNPQPKKVELVKNGMKYIDTIISNAGLNGDKLKRVLHKVKQCDFTTLSYTYEVFGKNFIMSQNDDIIKKMIENSVVNGSGVQVNFTNKENQNSFDIFKLVLDGQINYNTFHDHLNFHNFLNNLETIKWKSSNYEDFMDEHFEWSEKQAFYTSGDFKRYYGEKFKSEVERPLLGVNVHFPVLLTTSKEYNKESFIQSNCVKTYIKKPHSVIVSLRRDNVDSEYRVTIEYFIKYSGGKVVELKRVQSLGKFNYNFGEDWSIILENLDRRIDNLVKKELFVLPEIESIFGHKTIKSKLVEIGPNQFYDVHNRGSETKLDWDNDMIYNVALKQSIFDDFEPNNLLNMINELDF
jgi:hypothetical protein